MSSVSDWRVTPRRSRSELPKDITLDLKIDIFHERIEGWKLDIADQLINGIKDEKGNTITEGNPNAGYAVLDIILSYFEMVAKYQAGYLGIKSKPYFKKGVCMVFPELEREDPNLVDMLLDTLYYGARCGLYHNGLTDTSIYLEGGRPPITFLSDGKAIINPHELVLVVKRHFDSYIEQLKDVRNLELRQKFEKRFDEDNSP